MAEGRPHLQGIYGLLAALIGAAGMVVGNFLPVAIPGSLRPSRAELEECQVERTKVSTERDSLRAELKRVAAERDSAVADLARKARQAPQGAQSTAVGVANFEQSAPAPRESDNQAAPRNEQTAMRFDADGYFVVLHGCSRGGETVRCEFTATPTRAIPGVDFCSTNLVDESGHVAYATVSFSGRSQCGVYQVPTGLPLAFVLAAKLPGARTATLVFGSAAAFRDVPISQ